MRTAAQRLAPLILTGLLLGTDSPGVGGVLPEPRPAPDWVVSEWINGNPGALGQHRGKVVVIHFFQLWCPACNQFSLPVFQRWQERYGPRGDILIVGIHTVFEGHEHQTPEHLRQFVKQKGIRYPVGIDAFDTQQPAIPVTMLRFDTGGTPHIAIVDKAGQLRFSHFGRFEPAAVEFFIDRLLKEPAPGGRQQTLLPVEDPFLSGTYRVSFEQTSKSCGPLLPRREVTVELTVYEERMHLRLAEPVLGQSELTMSYDPLTGRVEGRARRRATQQGAELDLMLNLDGWFSGGSTPPVFEFEFWLDQQSDTVGRECQIQGRGYGERIE